MQETYQYPLIIPGLVQGSVGSENPIFGCGKGFVVGQLQTPFQDNISKGNTKIVMEC
jgi:hypothetical protein